MSEYRVLARKYRPTNFSDLIGQEVLVKTLSNAIARNRIAHAFLLTGIRGIGKTTTARIIAKALNCIGEDGSKGATITPCGKCTNCVAIAEDRHVDVLEMDAASRTGVDDIRDLIETVHYAPANARYKIYIIDEVHMLSKSAFNALLKTLEEPPAHVKFIFATTEIRKIPITILSRCQRFDLKRVSEDMLVKHLRNICTREEIQADDKSLSMIAAAALGSVRDALSLLDQAISHAEDRDGEIVVTANQVASMLGLSDKHCNFVLLEELLSGNISAAIFQLRQQYAAGAQPDIVLQDLLEIVHIIIQHKTGVEYAAETVAEDDIKIIGNIAAAISVTQLTRIWQLLLKSIQEAQFSANALMVAEMALIRIAHMAELPSPSDVVRYIKSNFGNSATHSSDVQKDNRSSKNSNVVNSNVSTSRVPASAVVDINRNNGTSSAAAAVAVLQDEHGAEEILHIANNPDSDDCEEEISSFEDVLRIFDQHKEALLYNYLEREARLVSFSKGRIELNFSDRVAADIPGKIAQKLSTWTAQRWIVILSQEEGQPTIYEQRCKMKKQAIELAKHNDLVKKTLEYFPNSEVIDIEEL